MRSLIHRLRKLEGNLPLELDPEERRRMLREQFARHGIHISGNFAEHADPDDPRTPGEKLRDFLASRERDYEHH